MIFLLGIITGILLSILIVSTLAYFRKSIEQKTTIIEKQLERMGPQPKGFIFEADDDLAEARHAIIEKNKALGKDTKLSDLL